MLKTFKIAILVASLAGPIWAQGPTPGVLPATQFTVLYHDASACARLQFLPGSTGVCDQYISVAMSSSSLHTQAFLVTVSYHDQSGAKTQTAVIGATTSNGVRVAWTFFYDVTNVTLNSVSVAPLSYSEQTETQAFN